MCRLAFFPPHFPRNDALDILMDMEGSNTQGFGFGYWDNNKPVINKWGKSLSSLLKNKNNKIMENMRGRGFDKPVIAHLRLASCGPVNKANAHPFLIGKNNIFIHNGTYSDASLIKAAMGKEISYTSETDSEVAGYLMARIGVKRFTKEINYGGVFMMLNKSGYLHLSVTNGDCCFSEQPDGRTLIASELDEDEYDHTEADQGWYIFNPEGQLSQKHEKYPSSKVTIIDYSKGSLSNPYSKIRRENMSPYLHSLQYDGGWHNYD